MAKDTHSHAEELARIEDCDFWSKVKTKLILDEIEGNEVLDVGCGSGLLSKTLAKKGYKVTAIDCDEKAIEIVKEKGIKGYVADINNWKTNEKFDCIIFADVLEHIDDDRSLIKKVHSMLKPNGCFVINVPSYQFLFGAHDISLGHKRRYSDKDLRKKLVDSGFKIDHLRHWNLLALPFTIVLTKVYQKDYPHERVSKMRTASKIIEKLLFAESKANSMFGISILCKAKKQRIASLVEQ
jgi:2-polyprenyl-3-methyl-5-hydroxy-6-metoxy-1,4-benzoquinol methylase